MATISFILPAYKKQFLQSAVDSILHQSFTDFELVVVDDCSPENLKEIVDQYSDERLKYVRNERNLGSEDLISAWNSALSYATGEWVVCAGDDDVYQPDYAKEMVRLTEKYPDVDIFHCRIAFINGSGEITRIGMPRAEYESPLQMIDHSFVNRLHQRIGDFMFRRSALMAHGGFMRSPRAWMSDIGTAIDMALKNGAVCSSRILFFWRQSECNISSQSQDYKDKLLACLDFKDWISQRISECPMMDKDDELIRPRVIGGVDRAIAQNLNNTLNMLSYCKWRRCIRDMVMDPGIRRICRQERAMLYCRRFGLFLRKALARIRRGL